MENSAVTLMFDSLQLLISTVDRVIKWRLHHMEELEKWVEVRHEWLFHGP